MKAAGAAAKVSWPLYVHLVEWNGIGCQFARERGKDFCAAMLRAVAQLLSGTNLERRENKETRSNWLFFYFSHYCTYSLEQIFYL